MKDVFRKFFAATTVTLISIFSIFLFMLIIRLCSLLMDQFLFMFIMNINPIDTYLLLYITISILAVTIISLIIWAFIDESELPNIVYKEDSIRELNNVEEFMEDVEEE